VISNNPRDADNESSAQAPPLPPGVILVRTLRGHTGFIGHIAWSPAGQLLASPAEDKTVRIWNVRTGDCVRTLEGHSAEVFSVAFDATGRTLASGSADQTVVLWDTESGKMRHRLEWQNGSVNSVAFDSTGKILAIAGDHSAVTLWKTSSGKLLRTLTGRQGVINRVTFDPVGGIVAGAGIDQAINLWDAASGELLRTLKGHRDSVNSVAFDPAGRMLVSGGADHAIHLWDVATGRQSHTVEGPTDRVRDVAVSCDGRLLAAKCQDGTVRIWQKDLGEPSVIIPVAMISEPARAGQPTSLAFHPSLPVLATVGSDPGTQTDEVIHIWELDLKILAATAREISINAEVAATDAMERVSQPVSRLHNSTILPATVQSPPVNLTPWNFDKADAIETRDSELSVMPAEPIVLPDQIPTSANAASFTAWAGDDRVTLAIVFTDVAGSTALGQQLKDHRMLEVRRAHFAQSRKLIEQYKGREIKTIGDSVMVAFRSVEKALDYAMALHNEPGNSHIKIRAGIHIGPMQIEENDVFGSAVNFAARVVESITGPEIWLSDQAKEDLDRSGALHHAGLKWHEHSAMIMKGFSGLFTLWSIEK
jgi:WD40 repeat protein/class 3 adenylate cyclase